MTQDTATRQGTATQHDTARTAMNVSDIRTQERPTETPRDDGVVLRLDSVDKHYPGVHAIKNVSLTVRRGEVHALVGQNGAGKSTLVGIAAGSVHPRLGVGRDRWRHRHRPHTAVVPRAGPGHRVSGAGAAAGSDRRREHAPEHARTAPARGVRPDRVGADHSRAGGAASPRSIRAPRCGSWRPMPVSSSKSPKPSPRSRR